MTSYNLLTPEGRQALRAALDGTRAAPPKAHTFPADWDLSDPRLRSLARDAIQAGEREEGRLGKEAEQLAQDREEWTALCRTGVQVSPTLVLWWDEDRSHRLRAAEWRGDPTPSISIRGNRWTQRVRSRIQHRHPEREEIPIGLGYRVYGGRVTHVWHERGESPWQLFRPRPNDPIALLSQGRTPYPLEHFRIPEDSP